MITHGDERDKVRHHLFHFYQNRPKDTSSNCNNADVDQDKEKNEQRQKEADETKGHGWR